MNRLRLLSLAHDVVTAAFSVADVVCDILVALEFWREDRLGFFWASVAIFLVAQAAYAFLFTAAYAAHRSPASRVLYRSVAWQ